MSRALIGHERTRARKAVAALEGSDPAEVARKLGMKRHTISAILTGRMLPGRTFATRATRLLPTS
jgi:plasmid maintenance system antidote protein VapI